MSATVAVPTQAQARANEALATIRAAILDGTFAPRQRLIEADLSSYYDLSRTAVRTALMALESEGLVERMPNRGARVRAISVGEAVEIVEVRIGLESLVARRAAERITAEQAAELAELRDAMRDAVAAGNLPEYSSLNQDMDRQLREIADHDLAKSLLERLLAQAARHQFRLAFDPHRAAESVDEHAAIIDAVVTRDADAAEATTRHHLGQIVASLQQSA